MPSLIRRLVVFTTVEGVVVQPSGQRNPRSLGIKYGTHEISSLQSPLSPATSALVEIHGIAGFLTLAPVSYLITILRREEVAHIRGIPIYVVTDVALIPLSSHFEAKKALHQARESLKQGSEREAISVRDRNNSEDEEIHTEDIAEDHDQAPSPSQDAQAEGSLTAVRPGITKRSSSNVVEDVISKKGQYGRFAERWFSRKGWTTEKRRTQGMSTEGAEKSGSGHASREEPLDPSSRSNVIEGTEKRIKADGSADSVHGVANALLPKLLRTTRMLLSSRSFFFSYDLDITRQVGNQMKVPPQLPLHKSVDPLFFWNKHLASPIIEGGHHAYVLPLMQGFVGQREFTIRKDEVNGPKSISKTQTEIENDVGEEEKPQIKEESSGEARFLLTLISRRSVKRPGLRYLRRGVDEEGETANTVETEQILSRASTAHKLYSFTQIRGSIPLFFSQSPYSFKPVPVLHHSSEVNQQALRRHFENLARRYGDVQVALLVDKKGGESEIGQKYEEHTAALNSTNGSTGKQIGFEWFDFHAICRGMKFENVGLLMETLAPKLEEFGITVESEGTIQQKQTGILRTNCMDCLDRTNVVQSACGQRALEQQLREEGLKVNLLTDSTTQWFNTLWADNGDQISREYSSTAALKGDYTRTRQRNYRGAINDLGLTLSRYFNNIVNDYFSQAAIDFLLGNVTSQVFEEFEATLQNRDPAMSMAKIRTNAIETSAKIVIADQHEDLIGGWTMLTPQEQNSVRTFPFQECVVLLTDTALYGVRYDWEGGKVASFERVHLQSITGIMKGTYITSPLAANQTDPLKNVGLIVKYKPGKGDIARVNTRSLTSAVSMDEDKSGKLPEVSNSKALKEKYTDFKLLAFKALPAHDSTNHVEDTQADAQSEQDLVNNVCESISRAALTEGDPVEGFIEESDIVSLQEAKRSTGLLEQWSHSLKKMVWA